jgi:hypothetical protein
VQIPTTTSFGQGVAFKCIGDQQYVPVRMHQTRLVIQPTRTLIALEYICESSWNSHTPKSIPNDWYARTFKAAESVSDHHLI